MTKIIRFFTENLEHIVFPRTDRESDFYHMGETAKQSEYDAMRMDFEFVGKDLMNATNAVLNRVDHGQKKTEIRQ